MKEFKLLLKEESGQSLVLVAVILFVLLGVSAYAVDLGYTTYQISKLQNAADSAALAGALILSELPGDDDVKLKTAEYANLNFSEDETEIFPVINRAEKSVEVKITHKTPKFFAGTFSQEDNYVNVRSKAKYSYQWDGEALPFINLNDNYGVGESIVLWENITETGDFESLWKDEITIVNPYDDENIYIDINYKDGLTITKGVVANVKTAVEKIMAQNKPVYVLSLSNDIIYSAKYSSLDNRQTIDYGDFVLLKVNIISFEPNGSKERIELMVLDIYDLEKNEYPKDYANVQAARIVSTLIE